MASHRNFSTSIRHFLLPDIRGMRKWLLRLGYAGFAIAVLGLFYVRFYEGFRMKECDQCKKELTAIEAPANETAQNNSGILPAARLRAAVSFPNVRQAVLVNQA